MGHLVPSCPLWKSLEYFPATSCTATHVYGFGEPLSSLEPARLLLLASWPSGREFYVRQSGVSFPFSRCMSTFVIHPFIPTSPFLRPSHNLIRPPVRLSLAPLPWYFLCTCSNNTLLSYESRCQCSLHTRPENSAHCFATNKSSYSLSLILPSTHLKASTLAQPPQPLRRDHYSPYNRSKIPTPCLSRLVIVCPTSFYTARHSHHRITSAPHFSPY